MYIRGLDRAYDPSTMTMPFKPTAQQLRDAQGRFVPDLIAADLKVLFVGINAGLYSAAVGHHFARPGNRFWPALHRAGFTPRQLSPFEEQELLGWGYGITNIVPRATATAAELSNEELIEGARRLQGKIRRYRPGCAAFLGITAYRTAFARPDAVLGRQELAIGNTLLWVLPNPSGLNAHYQLQDLARIFAQLRHAVQTIG